MKSISTFNQLANSVWSSFVLAELVACIKHANSVPPHPNNWSTNPPNFSQHVLPFLSHTSVRQDEQRRVWNFNIEMFFSFGLEAFNEQTLTKISPYRFFLGNQVAGQFKIVVSFFEKRWNDILFHIWIPSVLWNESNQIVRYRFTGRK